MMIYENNLSKEKGKFKIDYVDNLYGLQKKTSIILY